MRWLIVSAAVEVGRIYPIIRSAGTSRQVATGGRIVLSMAYSGAEPLSFQWYKDGKTVAGATAPTLTVENADPDDAGNYVLRISNGYGSFDSEPIRLVVADASALSWSVRYPEARLIGMNTFVDMGDEVWALGDGRIQVWHEDSGWETRDLGYAFDATDGIRVGARYFLSGNPGAILESEDGYAWTYTNLGNEQDGLKMAAGNGRMLAMGRNAGLWVSEDFGQWIRSDLNFALNTFPDLVFFKGQFLLATRDGPHGAVRLNRSADGVTWTDVTTVNGGVDGGPFFLIADDGLLFSVPSRVFLTSSDGLTWAETGEPSMTHLTAYVDGVYYGRMAQWHPGLRSSTDLVHWNDSPIDPNRRVEYLHWRDGRYFLGLASEYGSDAIVTARALDLKTMGAVPAFDRQGVVSLEGLSWLNGEFQSGQLRSGDGVLWHRPQFQGRPDARMSYGNGFYTAPQSNASGRHPVTLKIDFRLYEAMSDSGSFTQAAFGFGVHAIIGWGTVLYSESGDAWTKVDLGEGHKWTALRFINGHFMAVGEAGMVALGRSPEDWTTLNSSFPQDLRDVTYGADRYVVATGSETLLVSTDATSWQAVVPETGCAIWDVAFGDGRFVAVGDGCAFESTDGLGWIRNDPAEPDLAFREVAFGAGTFVALTDLGEICQLSDPVELAPVVNLIRGPVPFPVAPLDHLVAEFDVIDPSDPEVLTRVFRRGVEILETTAGRMVVDLETRSPGDHELVIEAVNSSGLKTSQAFSYTVNDYPGISAIAGAPGIGTMANFKGQVYRGGEWGVVQRAAGDGRWIDLPSVPDHHMVIQLFSTKTWLYAVTQDFNYREIYRSRDGFGWEKVIMNPGRLEKAGALTYSSNSNHSFVLTDNGDFHLAGEGTTKIVAFAGQFVAGSHSNHSQGASARFWMSGDGVEFRVLQASAGGFWQGPFLADGQLMARNAADSGLLLTSDLIHWEKVQVPESFPGDWELYQAGSGLVIRSGLQAWYSDDARTWTKFTDQGFAGAVAVGDADLVIAGDRVLVFRTGQDPTLLGELPLSPTHPQATWTAVEGLDGFIWITPESDPYSWGGDGNVLRFRIDPEVSYLEIVTEPRRGILRKALPGPSQSAFLIWRPDSASFLLGRNPFTAVSSEAPEVPYHELIASDGSSWVLAGEHLDTAKTSDGINWESGELVEGYESIAGWSQFYGRAPSWLAYHEPTQQFLAGWSHGFTKPGWWRSSDGLTWNYEAVENWYFDIGSIVSNGEVLVGLYHDSEIAVCSDGSAWNRSDPGIPGRLTDLRLLAPDVFAVHEGLTGRIHTSKDGLIWIRADHPDTGAPLTGLMVVSDDQPRILSDGTIWTSLDGGATWQEEGEVGFAPANARFLFHLDGDVYSEDLLTISTLEDLSLEVPDSNEILGGRGRQITVPVRITNNAVSGSLSGTFQLTWNLTQQAVWNPTEGGGLQTVSVAIDGLAGGATVEKILELTLPDGIEAGYHHFTAWLDSKSELFEINETNNYASTETPSVRVPAWTLEATAESGGQIVIAPFRLRYTDGERVSVTPRANEGYAFVGWADGPSGGIDVLNLTMDRNRSVTARFEPRYGLSLRTIGAGSITVDPERSAYAPGTEVLLTATAGKHWRLAGWGNDVSGSAPSVSLSMSQDHLATAVFEQDYTLFSGEVFSDTEQLDPAVSGPEADPDSDGFNNLAEFLLGADPNSSGDWPDVRLVVTQTGAGLVFTRRIGTAGHRLSVRWSTDLINWSSHGMTESVQPLNSILEIVESTLFIEFDSPVFIRLTAEEINAAQ